MKKLCVALTFLHSCLSATPIPLIRTVRVRNNRVDIAINKQFKRAYLKEDFFVEYKDVNLEQFDYSIVTLPFIMNVISLVWISGKDYEVDEMDTEVYASLQTLKEVFKLFHPETPWEGRLIPKKLVNHHFTHTSDSIALLFSGGVDSTTSSLVHRDKKQLLVTAWGQSCLPLTNTTLWNKVYKRITSFAQDYGHETTYLTSNYYYFMNFSVLKDLSPEITSWRMDTVEDIGWAGLIAPIMLSRGISTLRIGSSENWNIPYSSAAHPYIDSNISFMGLKFYHDLFSMSRYDKIAYIVNQANKNLIKKPQLIICQRPGNIISCGTCEKCILTLALLLSVEADPRDYGYALSPKKAAHNIHKTLKREKEFGSSILWEYKNLQQKLYSKPVTLLSWLPDIDFSKKKAYDMKVYTELDWDELHRRYPHVKGETT